MDRLKHITLVVPVVAALVGVGVIAFWVASVSVEDVEARVPGLDLRGTVGSAGDLVASGEPELLAGDGKPADIPGSWPWFRGARWDNIGESTPPLARQWPAEGPRKLWSVDLGEGFASPAVQNGRVFLLDYDRARRRDVLRCLSLADGKTIWSYSYPVVVKRSHGMSRTVPALWEKLVLTLGPKCHVLCVDSATGARRWAIDLVEQYGAKVPEWYAGQCPLIDRGRAILAPAGPDALVIAVDMATGQVVWKTPNPLGWKMTHASVMPMDYGGKRSYVYCGTGGVAGVSADDGRILWSTTDWKITIATVPSPVCTSDGRIFLCGGYNAGAVMLQLSGPGDRPTVQTAFRLKASQFGATQHTPILYRDHLYGIREKDRELVCLDLAGQQRWHSGSEHRFGSGPFMIADGMIFALDDDGVLTLAEAKPAGYTQLAQAKVLEGPDAWGPLTLVAGRLLVRDLNKMTCLDVRKP